jgi:chitinase
MPAWRHFVARYEGPGLIGFDFDIESTQTPETIQSLVARIQVAQRKRPNLRWSFTLPTLAASDASRASLNALGQQVLGAIREARLDAAIINLMVMDYGPASAAACVVKDGRCDMAASAIQAARNLNAVHGVPMNRIALTPMIGVNDVVENVFTPEDATQLAQFARTQQLAGLHFWSLDRDTPCVQGATAVSPTCNSLNTLAPLAFSRAFSKGLRP